MRTRNTPFQPKSLQHIVWLLLACQSFSGSILAQAYEEPPIQYSASATSNRADFLALAIRAVPEKRFPEAESAALEYLLNEFDVLPETQTLVFSRTSLQRDRISPRTPRALFFSDDCYIGYVPGGILELTLHDPKLGLVFYEVRPREQLIRRSRDCLSCHGGSRTGNWPGVLVRSVYPAPDGSPITSTTSYVTRHDSPLEERWGGWYVTGKHGESRHLGNQTAKSRKDPTLNPDHGANLTDLKRFFDPSPYPNSRSDIVALMVLEHQCEMHNRLSRGMLRTRKWMQYQKELSRTLGEAPSAEPKGTALTVINGEADRIVEYLLFVNEAPLPDGGIEGHPDFQAAFRRNRTVDPEGRSLKDLDLKTRLFRYRCSYMIYSSAFDTLPPVLKRAVYDRLATILTDAQPAPEFQHLPEPERATILDHLTATKPDFAAHLAGR